MYLPNEHEVAALKRLRFVRQRLFVQRLLELTHDDTHPFLLAGPGAEPLSVAQLATDAVSARSAGAVLAAADNLRDALLRRGASVDSQRLTFRQAVLDRNTRYSHLSFEERVESVAASGYTGNADSEGELVSLGWRIHGSIPRRTFVKRGALKLTSNSALLNGVHVASGQRASGATVLRTGAHDSRGARDRYSTASQLRSEGSVLLDLLRVTNPDEGLTADLRIEVSSVGRAHGTWLEAPAVPRLSGARINAIAGAILSEYERRPFDPSLRRLLNAIRWLSVFVSRWRESPTFAAPVLYMALEAIHGRCISQHQRDRCSCANQTAAEIFGEATASVLTSDISSYLTTVLAQKAKGREYPLWLDTVFVSRIGAPTNSEWLRRLRVGLTRCHLATPASMDDPLLLWRVSELLAAELPVRAAAFASEGLRRLRQARNAIAHEGRQMEEESKARELASLGVEVLLCLFEKELRNLESR